MNQVDRYENINSDLSSTKSPAKTECTVYVLGKSMSFAPCDGVPKHTHLINNPRYVDECTRTSVKVC